MSKRRLSALLVAVLLAILALVMLVAVPTEAQEQQRFIYTGTSTMRVQLVNVQGQNTGVETFQAPIEVVLQNPLPRDPNPFWLVAGLRQYNNDPGEVSIWSSAPVGTDSNGDKIVFRFWTLRELGGPAFEGV